MNRYAAAYQQQTHVGWTRIDMLLMLYDKTIERTEQAIAALKRGEAAAAKLLAGKVGLLVGGLVAGIKPDTSNEITCNLLRLFRFVIASLQSGDVAQVEGALYVLCQLREGYQGIRDDALRLERAGLIPPADKMQMFHAIA